MRLELTTGISLGALGAALAVLAAATCVQAVNSRLAASVEADGRTAAISCPAALAARAVGRPTRGGCGFEVDWGDAGRPVFITGECASGLRHRYAAPGSYSVKARTFRPPPNDPAESERSGTATVTAR